jgi:predicted esterase
MRQHHLTVSRTARYFTLGPDSGAGEIWFVLHGYGQLAERFLGNFAPLNDGSRLLVAPEGLSRFYVSHADKKVGATWMTREDRLNEIGDYVRYLDALAADVRGRASANAPHHVLGFSQGCATAVRWVTQGETRARRLVLWGGEVPPDLALERAEVRTRLASVELLIVAGSADEFITPKIVRRDVERLEENGVPHRVIRYQGGHEILADVLGAISVGNPARP